MTIKFLLRTSLLSWGLLFSSLLFSQPDRSDSDAMRSRMEAMAVGFLTEKLELDGETAQVFWPIFNAHKEVMEGIQKRKREAKDKLAQSTDVSMEEFEILLKAFEEVEVEEVQLRSTFLKDVATAFDPDFALRCVQAQQEFRAKMRQGFESRMSPRNGRGRGNVGRGAGRNRR